MATVHTYPDDSIEHVTDGGDCPCGPTTEAVFREDGSNGWLVTHRKVESCVVCQTSILPADSGLCDAHKYDDQPRTLRDPS